ncbi:MAG: NGG1p interacting factor NIF3, partial [Clostridiales bacterium]
MMKLQEIYQLAIKMGMAADPRGLAAVEKVLIKAQKAYDKLDEEEQDFFDLEKLHNPYGDTRMLNGDPEAEIHKLFCGVDVEIGEITLIEALNRRGAGIDLALAHHPEGGALANLGEVMNLQPGCLSAVGVLANVAEGMLEERINEVERSIHSANHFRAVDGARLLDLNMMCVHTPADNLVTQFLTELFTAEQPETIGDVVRLLKEVPEYYLASS